MAGWGAVNGREWSLLLQREENIIRRAWRWGQDSVVEHSDFPLVPAVLALLVPAVDLPLQQTLPSALDFLGGEGEGREVGGFQEVEGGDGDFEVILFGAGLFLLGGEPRIPQFLGRLDFSLFLVNFLAGDVLAGVLVMLLLTALQNRCFLLNIFLFFPF